MVCLISKDEQGQCLVYRLLQREKSMLTGIRSKSFILTNYSSGCIVVLFSDVIVVVSW